MIRNSKLHQVTTLCIIIRRSTSLQRFVAYLCPYHAHIWTQNHTLSQTIWLFLLSTITIWTGLLDISIRFIITFQAILQKKHSSAVCTVNVMSHRYFSGLIHQNVSYNVIISTSNIEYVPLSLEQYNSIDLICTTICFSSPVIFRLLHRTIYSAEPVSGP